MKLKSMTIAVWAALLATPAAQAAAVAEALPFEGAAFGQQSDASTPAYVQGLPGAGSTTLTAITWWGYHGTDSGGAAFDDFAVYLNGSFVAGTMSVAASGPALTRYTLSISPWMGSPSSLAVVNQSPDVEWYWQSADSSGAPHASEVAYRLDGSVNAIPEPSSVALMLGGLAGLAAWRRKTLPSSA